MHATRIALAARRVVLTLLAASTLPILAAPPSKQPTFTKKAQIAQTYGKLPLSFEANQGQSNPQVKFLSRVNGYSLFLTNRSAVLSLTKATGSSPYTKAGNLGGAGRDGLQPIRTPDAKPQTDTIEMQLANANPNAKIEGADQLPGHANYLLGNDPAKWHTNVPTYAKVRYTNVYNGIDLVYYGNQRQLEYDFIVAPQADPKKIRLHFAGDAKLKLSEEGDLILAAANGTAVLHKPVVYQQDDWARHRLVQGHFTLLGNQAVGFTLGDYDHSKALVIDPTLVYSTYLGGSGDYDRIWAITSDSSGDAYVTGTTTSQDFPVTSGTIESSFPTPPNYPNAGTNVTFVSKLNPAGTALLYSTYLGDAYPSASTGYGIAVDSSGDAFIAGQAEFGFPTTAGVLKTTNAGINGFVAKLDPSGSKLLYSTFLGGTNGSDWATGIAIDSAGDAYVTGIANSSNFPVTPGAYQTSNTPGVSGGFVAKLNPDATAPIYASYLNGSNGAPPSAIAVDPNGEAYVAGHTISTDFPVVNAFQPTMASNSSAYLTKFNASGSNLIYSTYFGGSGQDQILCIAVDAAGHAFVGGSTGYGSNFPITSNAYQTQNDDIAGFVSELSPDGSTLVYSTYLGGAAANASAYVTAIAVDSAGRTHLAGNTGQIGFPTTSDAFQSTPGSNAAAFYSLLSADGSQLLYSTFLGGSYSNLATGIALNAQNNAYIGGYTNSLNFPLSGNPLQSRNKSSTGTGFISAFSAPVFAATTTSLNADANPQRAGAKVTFTAFVQPVSGAGIPTGKVSFAIDGGKPTTVALDGTGHATLTIATLTPGKHKITAAYSGDVNYSASTSTTLNEAIYGPAASIAVTSGSGQTAAYGKLYALPLTVIVKDANGDTVPGATVTFTGTGLKFSSATATTNAAGVASVTATPTAVGTLTAKAAVAGAATPATFTETAAKAALTVTATSVSVAYNAAIPTLAYTITGYVNGDTAAVVTGKPTETTTALKGSQPGTYPITLGAGTLAAANYTFKLVNGTVTITALGVTAEPAGTESIAIAEATSGATVYYTTNGSTPTTASTVYKGPISVTATTTIKFIAVAPGYTPSAVRTIIVTVD